MAQRMLALAGGLLVLLMALFSLASPPGEYLVHIGPMTPLPTAVGVGLLAWWVFLGIQSSDGRGGAASATSTAPSLVGRIEALYDPEQSTVMISDWSQPLNMSPSSPLRTPSAPPSPATRNEPDGPAAYLWDPNATFLPGTTVPDFRDLADSVWTIVRPLTVMFDRFRLIRRLPLINPVLDTDSMARYESQALDARTRVEATLKGFENAVRQARPGATEGAAVVRGFLGVVETIQAETGRLARLDHAADQRDLEASEAGVAAAYGAFVDLLQGFYPAFEPAGATWLRKQRDRPLALTANGNEQRVISPVERDRSRR